MRRVSLCLLVTAVAAGVAALPATGKERVKATLATNVPLDAKPGARLRVAWTLTYADGRRRRQGFGANGVFVRLLSASGARAETGFAPTGTHASGEYAATVVVPEGGIGSVKIGLRGWTSGASGSRRSDLLFPITNDPEPRSARVASPRSEQAVSERAGGGSRAWIFVVGLASLLATCTLAFVVAQRKRPRHATGEPSQR